MDENQKSVRLMRQIDENLRKVYEEAVDTELPDRFQELLRRLREQDKSQ
jgi:hypothetical protein